jgi:hypothetical protein
MPRVIFKKSTELALAESPKRLMVVAVDEPPWRAAAGKRGFVIGSRP